jgi:hypothetical protein
MKLGLDFHGVIDKHPETFAELSRVLCAYCWEVHIITGQKITEEFLEQLRKYGIQYTHMFSIIDYHEKLGTSIHYNEKGPWIDADLWNRTKAEYCEKNGIILHIDDSDTYGKFFSNTIYLQIQKKNESNIS